MNKQKITTNKTEGAMLLRSRYLREFESKFLEMKASYLVESKKSQSVNCSREVRSVNMSEEIEENSLKDRLCQSVHIDL